MNWDKKFSAATVIDFFSRVAQLRLSVFICGCILTASASFASAKDKVDLIIVNGTVVTIDPNRRIIENGAVAVRGDSVLAVDTSENISARYEAVRIINARGTLILPGLINAHAHAAMSLFRGLADDLSFDEWLHKYIFPAEARNVTEEFVMSGTRLSIDEMLRGGITTYADMYYFEDAVARVTKEAGMRGVLGETILDFPAPDNKSVETALAYTQTFLDHWKGDPLIVAAVAPHSIYTCSEKTLQKSAALARKNRAPILIHIAEAPFELEQSREKNGASPVQYLARIGILGPDVLGAHCIWVDSADIVTLAHFGVGCAFNPSSNMKTAAGLMPAPAMLSAGVAVGIATDGAASNNNQDLFAEMDLGAKLQKFGHMNPRVLPAEQVVEMATITGARALHMENQIGSIEPGKKADLILVETTSPHAAPMYNVYSQIVYALKAADVRTVIIGGKPVMEDRKMLTLDETTILEKANEYKKQVLASFSQSPGK